MDGNSGQTKPRIHGRDRRPFEASGIAQGICRAAETSRRSGRQARTNNRYEFVTVLDLPRLTASRKRLRREL